MEGKPGGEPTHGAQSYTGDELRKLRLHAGDDSLTFLLLRHTAFRGSDAVRITWREIHFDRREIERVTQKRKKSVVIPITSELYLRWSVSRQNATLNRTILFYSTLRRERECRGIDSTCGWSRLENRRE